MSIRLYVGNLPKEPVERQELQAVFADTADSISVKVIKDRKTGKCRGFAFVTVPTEEMADELIEKHNGQSFKESPLKIEKALPRSKGKSKEKDESKESKAETRAEEAPAGTAPPKRRSGGGKKSKGRSSTSSDPGSVQPDPRWADELAKLKEMLSTQTSNS